jgi:hypothetical protein
VHRRSAAATLASLLRRPYSVLRLRPAPWPSQNTDVRQNGGGALPFPLPLIVTYDLAIRTHTMTLGVAYKFD